MQSTIIDPSARCPENWEKGNWQFVREYCGEIYNYLIFKRVTDIIISIVVLMAIFPWLLPIVYVCIKLDSKGPIFFRQKRVGFLGRTFYCYKFRTMRINDAADSCRASQNDSRVTRVGSFLRNTCLDEIPQFINVLLGDMSIVGPRPHMLKDSDEFSTLVSNYSYRNMARPGITGLAQVRGYRGPATTFQSIFRRYQWDSYYVRNVSLTLDLRIMVQTGLLIMRSICNRNQPVPVDNGSHNNVSHDTSRPVYNSESLVAAKKIA